MATTWSITKYRDPEKLDISVLGKALQYKQNEYDTTVNQTQQLINQYAGTDLLRDVDKQYFGERLNTLVSYINESGTRDWSRKSVARDIQNYVSSALDKNVLNAIGSTQMYRKQMAEIDDIKKNKPDQYSAQNEWFATSDLQRYLRSGQVGDVYNAQTYVPYTDVNKAILENSKYLKDFGVEYYTSTEGNSYFRKINTHEKIDPTTSSQFLQGMLDGKMMNQLYIDGQYKYKDISDGDLKNQYDSKLNSYTDYNQNEIDKLKALKVSATKDKKAEYDNAISILESKNNEINKSKLTVQNRSTMASYLHNNAFLDKWTNFFSYDRIKDYKIDDSGFQIYKLEKEVEQNNRNYELKAAEFTYNMKKDQADMALKRDELALKAKSSGMTRDASGNWVVDPTSSINGMKTSDTGENLEEVETPSPFMNKQAEFYSNTQLLTSTVADELKTALAKDSNAELRKQMGSNNPKQIAYMLVNSPSKSRVLYNLLSDNAKQIVDATISSKNALVDIDKNLDSVRNDMRKFGNSMLSNKTKESLKNNFAQATAGFTIDPNGNVVKGNVMQGNDKFAQAARTIGAVNFRLMSGKLSEDETEQYKRIALKELAGTGMSQKQLMDAYNKLVFRKTYKGFWDGLGQVVSEGIASNTPIPHLLKGAQDVYNNLNDSTKKATFADDFIKYANSALWNGNRRGATGEISDRIAGFFTANEDTNSIGLSDIDRDALGFDPSNMEERWKLQTDGVRQKLLADKATTFNKAVNIDLSSKFGKTVISDIKSYLPVSAEIQKDGIAKITIDQASGMANVTVGVKDGKSYEPTTVQVKMTDLPTPVLSNIRKEASTNLYSATNPYAVKYSEETEIPDSRQDFARKVALMPEEQRTNAFNNPPLTKEDIVANLTAVYGKEIVQQNSQEIKQILDKPISINMVPENGQWTLVANQDGANILRKPTTLDNYDPRLIEKYSSELVTNVILENIKKTLSNRY